MWQKTWAELAGMVLEAARSGGDACGDKQQAAQPAHRLCLAGTTCRLAVLGAMTALASLRVTGDQQGVDPAQLPPLPRLASLECRLQLGAEAAASWPGLGGLQ